MNRNKIKGSRIERKVVKLFEAFGYQALRSPASLSKTDILVNGFGTIQVKYRKSFLPIYKALDNMPKNMDLKIYNILT